MLQNKGGGWMLEAQSLNQTNDGFNKTEILYVIKFPLYI
jgi:hypothetical protein